MLNAIAIIYFALESAVWTEPWGGGWQVTHLCPPPTLPPHPIWGLNWNDFHGMVAGQASQSPQVGLGFLQHGSLRSIRFLTQWLRAPRANVPRFLGGSYKPFYVTAMEVPEHHFCPILSSKLLLCSLDPRAKEFNWIQLNSTSPPDGESKKKTAFIFNLSQH